MASRGVTAARFTRAVLNLFFWLGAVVFVLAVVGTLLTVLFAGDGFRGDASVMVALGDGLLPITRLASDSPAALSQPALVGGRAELRFETDDVSLVIPGMGGILLAIAFLLIATWILRGMLDRVLDGRPFDSANVRALHTLALLSVVAPIVLQAVLYFAARRVLSVVDVQGVELGPPLYLGLDPFLLALTLEVLASIFRHGADLEAEQALTI